MTQPTSQQEDNKARGVFTALMLLGGGFAGLAFAGVVLALDYMVHGEPHEREQFAQRAADRRRNRYEDALAWLDNDRAERQRHREATRAWFADDPATRGDKPSSGETAGKVLARAWNTVLAGAVRAKRGWQKGRDEARARRDDGAADWWKRPDADVPPEPTEPTPGPVQEAPSDPNPQPRPDVVDAELVPDAEPVSHEIVPVGVAKPAGPDPHLDDYQRRLDDLAGEVSQNSNGHRADPAIAPH